MHIVPRDDKKGGIKHLSFNDDLSYERNPVEMADEAETYRQLFEKRGNIV